MPTLLEMCDFAVNTTMECPTCCRNATKLSNDAFGQQSVENQHHCRVLRVNVVGRVLTSGIKLLRLKVAIRLDLRQLVRRPSFHSFFLCNFCDSEPGFGIFPLRVLRTISVWNLLCEVPDGPVQISESRSDAVKTTVRMSSNVHRQTHSNAVDDCIHCTPEHRQRGDCRQRPAFD